MAIRKAKFVGLSSADPDADGLLMDLLKYRWRMLASGLKYELDALANKDFRYLTKTYLPRKLREEDLLD